MAPPKLVPNKSGGASRRAYQGAFSKGMTEKGMGSLGKLQLKTPSLKGQTKPRAAKSTRDYAKADGNDPMNVSFGDTGFTEEDYE